MKKIFIILIISVAIVASCSKTKIFNGDLVIVEFPNVIDTLEGKQIKLNDIFTGWMTAYDSLLVFSANFSDNSSWVFNVKTGEHISSIIKWGQGPNEFITPTFLGQFEIDTDICVWVSDWSKNIFTLVNLTNNTQKRTISTSGLKNGRRSVFGCHFYLDDSLILIHNPDEMVNDDIVPPIYRIFNYITKEERVRYEPYNQFQHESELCLYAITRIKPDKTKLAVALLHFHQLTMIDIQTNKIIGYRLKNSPGFEDLIPQKTSIDDWDYYYRKMCVDDDFIYCETSVNDSVMMEVFDWNGNFIRRLFLDKKTSDVMSIAFDPVNKIMYLEDAGGEEEKLYSYDLCYLYPKKK